MLNYSTTKLLNKMDIKHPGLQVDKLDLKVSNNLLLIE